MKTHWRRYLPRMRVTQSATENDIYRKAVDIVTQATDHLNARKLDISSLDPVIDRLKSRETDDPTSLLALLILQAPRAARAQHQMDEHPHGYHDRTKRLYELIDFNDLFVNCVLNMPETLLNTFNERTKQCIDQFCKKLNVHGFSNGQWEAITHGLSREVAVYLGAHSEGLDARMTSRVQDAKGIDMIISDRQTRLEMNVDIKTPSAYHFRIKDLIREGRITDEQGNVAELRGYCKVANGHGGDAVRVVLLRISHEQFGDIHDFRFEHSNLLGRQIREILTAAGSEIR